ncbi:MAG: DsbA family protein [Gammaproteobacteria bacterium]|nr:DsbA family protein [Gammaproteobacteria bacterium]
MQPTTLYYIHDPMCSWCWAFTTVWKQIQTQLPPQINVKRLLGGLAPDSDQAMPIETQQQIKQAWQQIEQRLPQKKFNFDFWTNNQPRRSTYPACRAVIAARDQDPRCDLLITQAIQKAYYQQARNPSDDSTLLELATALTLDPNRFAQQLNAIATQNQLKEEIRLCRHMHVSRFPSLVLEQNGAYWPIEIDYNDAHISLEVIDRLLTA